ncbi:malectin domain-containing carbohydrate-binding protein, partial [Ruegeria atlantica]|uniref:malectin domain-containing carbohydrate-binding protein n=1 Tax=Ruegeria atlantica TaxID=81569 RepID=UPI002493FF1C
MAFSNPDISFGVTGLQGEAVNNPTALDFSKTGNPVLFVAQQDGSIWRLEVERQADGPDADTLPDFVVTNSTLIDEIKTDTQNYDDDGSANAMTTRQMTGLITTTDANGNDVLYVNSSDSRIAVGNDANLDTNSSQIHKITMDPDTGEVLSNVAIVRGLPRSEENHSVNGFDIAIDPVTGHEMLWVAVGANTNNGAPGNNFAGTVDYPYSGVILKIDLTVLEGYDVRVDGNGEEFILDLATLDDPTRPNIDLSTLNILNPEDAPNFTLDDNGTGTNGELNPDWAGGNNGLNAAKVVDKVLVSSGGQLQFVDNPLQIHSPGYRNPYDVEVTEDGEVFTWDNGPNTGWGGQPIPFVDDTPGDAINYVQDWTKELATNLFNESGSQGFGDQLHYAGSTSDEYGPYGGFTSPIRAAAAILAAAYNPDGSYKPGAGNPLLNTNGDVIFADETEAQAYLDAIMIIYAEQGDGNWVDVTGTTGLPADLHDIVSGYNWVHPGSSISDPTAYYDGSSVQDGTLYSPESQLLDNNADGSLKTVPASTNGLAEYTGTHFDGALNGAIVAASFDGNLYFEKPIDTDGDGRTDAVQSLGTINGFGSTPLTVATLGDDGLGTFIDNDGDGVDDFAGLIVAGTYGADNVTFFIPGGQAADPSTDLDLDGQNNTVDSHVGDPQDGRGVVVGANETLTWQFELSTPTTPPGAIPNGDSIAGDIGINAVWRNGVDPQVTSDGSPALYNPGIWNLGGASTFVSIDVADTGNAVGTANDQADVLGIGFEIQDNLSGITIMSEMLNVFSYTPNTDASKTWDGGEKFGLMVGPGDQSTFAEATIAVDASGGTPVFGLQLVVEENDVPTTVFVEIPGIDDPVRGIADPNLQIAIDVDLTLGAETITARARYVNDGSFTDWVSTTALPLPDDVKDAILGQYDNNGNITGAVVGLVSSAPAGDDSFAASWDWIEVTGQDAVETTGTVLYRWNAGSSNVTAVDGGLDWIADASVLVGGPTNIYTGNISTLDSSASQYTIPTDIFTQERWDPSSGGEMNLEFGNGTLESGAYAVRLLMGESYFTQAGSRAFDVSIENQLFLNDLDLVATLGTGTGGVFEWVGQVTDGTIDIDFQRVIENPQINGVEIVKLDTTPVNPVVSANAGNFSETDGTVSLSITSATAVPSGQTIDVNFELRPVAGGATPQVDYASIGLTYDAVTGFYSGSGQIAAGQTALDILIDILPDAEIEGSEAFELHVTNVSGANATIGTAVATVTIGDLEDSVNGTDIGDFSDDGLNPTVVNLTQGDTVLVATQDGDPTRDYDYVTIVVPTGHVLSSLTLSGYADYDTNTTNASFLGMQAGTQFTEGPTNPDSSNLLGGVIYDEFGIGNDLLANMADGVIENAGGLTTIGFATPLEAGSYTLWWSQGGSPTTSTITATVDPENPPNQAPVITAVSDLAVDELETANVQ